MDKDKIDIDWNLRLEKHFIDVDKALSDINKNKTDVDKALSEIKLNDKKLRWFEVALILTAVGLIIAFTKLFL